MPSEDWYSILDVAEDATDDEIKKAYRKKAMEWHPDRAPGNEHLFKKLVEAYAVLSDPKQREEYDVVLRRRRNTGSASAFTQKFSKVVSNAADVVNNIVDDNIFEKIDILMGRKFEPHNVEIKIKISLEELYNGADKQIVFKRNEACEACKGRGAKTRDDFIICNKCYTLGRMPHYTSIFTKKACDKCDGRGKIIINKCEGCSGTGLCKNEVELTIPIPKNLNTKDTLIVPGEGEHGGNLLIAVELKEHPYFEVSWPDLSAEIPIKYYQAILGDNLEIDTLKGSAFFKVPPGTQHGDSVLLKGYGLRKEDEDDFGDLTVNFSVVMPAKVTQEHQALLEEIRNLDKNKKKIKPNKKK